MTSTIELKEPPPSLSRVNSQAETPRTNPLNGSRRVGYDSDDSDDETKRNDLTQVPNKIPLKKLEDDPYYKQLMSCSCAKTLKQTGGSRSRKHRTSKKHRKTRKIRKLKKTKNSKNRKNRKKTRRR
jgi:hypothetical protein